MSDEVEQRITTSEITTLLNHKSAAATRSWIRNQKLEEIGINLITRENEYSLTEVERKISEMPRGPYEKTRPTDEEPPRHGQLPDH